MVQRRGAVPASSTTDQGTLTHARPRRTTTSSFTNALTEYQAPRRKGYGPSTFRRAQ